MKNHIFGSNRDNKKISPKAELAGFLCLLLALGLFCVGAARVLTPKRQDYGATWAMYLEEEPNTVDVLFMGSSLAYCDVVPGVLYEESGVTSYVMAGPRQPMSITYYYLRECCKTQSPGTVFIECTGFIFESEYSANTDIKPNLTFMPWTENRLRPTLDYTEGDTLIGLLWPLYAYHGRWTEAGLSDLKPQGADPLCGYTYLEEICPLDEFTERNVSEELDNGAYDENLEFAGKILDFCQERGIRPVFYITPSVGRLPDVWRERIEKDLHGLGVELVDFNREFDSFGFDLQTDFFDSFHLNCRGAEKFSKALGARINQWASPAAAHDKELWQSRGEIFHDRLEGTLASEPKYKNDSTAANATADKDDKEGEN